MTNVPSAKTSPSHPPRRTQRGEQHLALSVHQQSLTWTNNARTGRYPNKGCAGHHNEQLSHSHRSHLSPPHHHHHHHYINTQPSGFFLGETAGSFLSTTGAVLDVAGEVAGDTAAGAPWPFFEPC